MKLKLLSLIFIQSLICNQKFVKADWVQCSNGLTELHINAILSNGNYLFAGTDWCSTCGGVFISTNNGDSWAIIPQLEYAGFISMSKNNMYVYSVGSALVFSSNNGINWLSYNYMPNGSHTYHQVATNGNNIFVGLGYNSADPGGIYRSTDYGFNWVQTSFPTGQNQNVVSIAINNNYIFASSGLLYGTQRSSDNGNTWIQCLNTAALPIAVKGDSVYLFGGPYPGYFYFSSNNGTNWTQFLDSLVARSLLVYGNYLFAGGSFTGGGFYISSNNGISWYNKSEEDTTIINLIYALCISNGYIFAGTDGAGVFRRPLSELTQVKLLSNNIPKKYLLKQNYPNPFNPVTTIEYEIPKLSNVTLKIYDVLGLEVIILINEKLSNGYYKVEWNANNYSSGIYFYQLLANNEIIDTKKLVIIK